MNDMSKVESAYWQPEPWSFMAGLEKARARFWRFYEKRPRLTIILVAAAIILLYTERHLYHPLFLAIRIYSMAIVLLIASALGAWWVFMRWDGTKRAKLVVGTVLLLLTAFFGFFGKGIHEYVSQYWRYKTLERSLVELNVDPLTDHERILPLHGVYTLATGRMNETEKPTLPDLVRSGGDYRWTMAIEPSSVVGRLIYKVEEILDVSATEAAPDFSRQNPEKVFFTVGESLLWSSNIKTCTRLAFGLIRSFSYEPGNVYRVRNDAGEWVKVVSLIKWTGWFFPKPDFGGVQVVEQVKNTAGNRVVDWLGRNLWGCGRYIPPKKIKDHKFLVGQNLMPYDVTRFMASSLRFQAGFFGPLRYTNIGDLRIADMPNDVNQMPFTLFHRMPQGEEKLYQFFGLEPKDKESQGLSMSFYYPADSIGRVYILKHIDRRIPIGVTTVEAQVRASKKHYDWSNNAVVEVRPYTHSIADSAGRVRPRFAYMVTVVATKERKPGAPLEFTSGSNPEVALVDAYWNKVVWVDSEKPSRWPEQLRESLAETWARER